MRPAYYIKRVDRVSAPSSIVSVICEQLEDIRDDAHSTVTYRCGRIYASTSVRKYGSWTGVKEFAFDTGDEFHSWLEDYAITGRLTYVFSPVASDNLRITGFYDRIDKAGAAWEGRTDTCNKGRTSDIRDGRYRFRDCILRGNPDIVRYTRDDRGICWLSSHQYISSSEDDVFKHSEERKRSTLCRCCEAIGQTLCEPCRSIRWLYVIRSLSDWWIAVRGGPWRFTVGGLAMSFFRARVQPRTILRHCNETSAKIEERALFGGRASVYYMGPVGFGPGDSTTPNPRKRDTGRHVGGGAASPDGRRVDRPPPAPFPGIDGPIYQIDVRSMYPYLLATCKYPIEHLHNVHNVTPKFIRGMCDEACVIASVRLRARCGEYPYRKPQSVVYPVGEYNTCLCGPDLIRAIDSDEVSRIYTACVYKSGYPFAEMARELLTYRAYALEAGNRMWEQFIKQLSNAFPGKLAQQSSQWVRRKDVPAETDWGMWPVMGQDSAKPRWFRSIAGLVWEHTRDNKCERTLASCFAYLTCYGRNMMRRIRESFPKQCIVSQDTDGLWCLTDPRQFVPVSDSVERTSPGQMRLVRTSMSGQWYTPKHYWTDYGWILAGYHDMTYDSLRDVFVDTQSVQDVFTSRSAPVPVLSVRTRQTSLKGINPGGVVSPEGWVYPATV